MKARSAASIALIGALLLGTSGCTLFAPQGTLVYYQPSDGTAGTVGDVEVVNAIALSEDGVDASILMFIVNSGSTAATVNFQITDASGAKVTIPVIVAANSSVSVGDGAESVVFRDVNVPPGALLPVYVQYGDNEGTLLQVPVLDGSTVAYSTLLPTPLPTITPTPVPEPTDLPEPVESPAA